MFTSPLLAVLAALLAAGSLVALSSPSPPSSATTTALIANDDFDYPRGPFLQINCAEYKVAEEDPLTGMPHLHAFAGMEMEPT